MWTAIIQIYPQPLYFNCSVCPYSDPVLLIGAKWSQFFSSGVFMKLLMVFSSEILCIKLFFFPLPSAHSSCYKLSSMHSAFNLGYEVQRTNDPNLVASIVKSPL